MPCCKNVIFYKLVFTESQRGHPKLALENYVYVRRKELNGGVISYECEGRRYHGCKAKVKVLGEEIVG